MKKAFFYFAGLVVMFILAAIILGDYYSALTGLIFYVAGIGATKLIDHYLDK